MPLLVLIILTTISLLITRILLQPLEWLGSVGLPGWLWLAIALALFSWCLGEQT